MRDLQQKHRRELEDLEQRQEEERMTTVTELDTDPDVDESASILTSAINEHERAAHCLCESHKLEQAYQRDVDLAIENHEAAQNLANGCNWWNGGYLGEEIVTDDVLALANLPITWIREQLDTGARNMKNTEIKTFDDWIKGGSSRMRMQKFFEIMENLGLHRNPEFYENGACGIPKRKNLQGKRETHASMQLRARQVITANVKKLPEWAMKLKEEIQATEQKLVASIVEKQEQDKAENYQMTPVLKRPYKEAENCEEARSISESVKKRRKGHHTNPVEDSSLVFSDTKRAAQEEAAKTRARETGPATNQNCIPPSYRAVRDHRSSFESPLPLSNRNLGTVINLAHGARTHSSNDETRKLDFEKNGLSEYGSIYRSARTKASWMSRLELLE